MLWALIICICVFAEQYSFKVRKPRWPAGSYGLPRPINGCPQYWKEGLRYHDTENDHSSNRHSLSYHLSGSVNEHGIRQEFCIKEDSVFDDPEVLWPDGQYCIYKYTGSCPKGLVEGWVFWDDENQDTIDGGNMVAGYTPEGVYELDTLMYFCCNTKGNKSLPIDLPLDKPFYLLAYNSKKCQSVNGAIGSIEYIKWDDEDRGNTNAHSAVIPYGVSLDPWDTTMYFCYYDTGICGRFGTVCQNVSIDESGLEGKSTVVEDTKGTLQESMLAPIIKTRSRTSGKAAAIGGSIAAFVVSAGVAGLALRQYWNKKREEDRKIDKYLSEEEIFPLPDQVW